MHSTFYCGRKMNQHFIYKQLCLKTRIKLGALELIFTIILSRYEIGNFLKVSNGADMLIT